MSKTIDTSILRNSELLEVLNFFSKKTTSKRIVAAAPSHLYGCTDAVTLFFETPPSRRKMLFRASSQNRKVKTDLVFSPTLPYEYTAITCGFGARTKTKFSSCIVSIPPMHSLVPFSDSTDFCFPEIYPNLEAQDGYVCFGSFEGETTIGKTLLDRILNIFTNIYSTAFNSEILCFFDHPSNSLLAYYLLRKFDKLKPLPELQLELDEAAAFFDFLTGHGHDLTRSEFIGYSQTKEFPYTKAWELLRATQTEESRQKAYIAFLKILSHPDISYSFNTTQLAILKRFCKKSFRDFFISETLLDCSKPSPDIFDDEEYDEEYDNYNWDSIRDKLASFTFSSPITSQKALRSNFLANAAFYTTPVGLR